MTPRRFAVLAASLPLLLSASLASAQPAAWGTPFPAHYLEQVAKERAAGN